MMIAAHGHGTTDLIRASRHERWAAAREVISALLLALLLVPMFVGTVAGFVAPSPWSVSGLDEVAPVFLGVAVAWVVLPLTVGLWLRRWWWGALCFGTVLAAAFAWQGGHPVFTPRFAMRWDGPTVVWVIPVAVEFGLFAAAVGTAGVAWACRGFPGGTENLREWTALCLALAVAPLGILLTLGFTTTDTTLGSLSYVILLAAATLGAVAAGIWLRQWWWPVVCLAGMVVVVFWASFFYFGGATRYGFGALGILVAGGGLAVFSAVCAGIGVAIGLRFGDEVGARMPHPSIRSGTSARIVGVFFLATGLAAPPALVVEADEATPMPIPAYAVTDLGTLGGEASRAWGINAAGLVAGSSDDAASRERAVVWEGRQATDLGTLGGPESRATDVNDRGQVVGSSTTAAGQVMDGPGTRAFLWEAGRMTDLGTLGGMLSAASEVNASGQVVGASETEAGDLRAFIWESGRMTDLGTLGGSEGAATAVNDVGQVVGQAGTAGGQQRAYLWEAGRMTDLGALGGESSTAYDINCQGQVVGDADTGDGARHAFLWHDGRMIDLGATAGVSSQAAASNCHGQIVGWAETDSGHQYAALWSDGSTIDLNETIPANSGWTELGIALGINDHGQIVGYGRIGEAFHAFLLTPALVGLGVPAAAFPS